MTQATHGKPTTESHCPAPTETQALPLTDDRVVSGRIPDAVAVLSYGTPVLGRFGGGPRIF